MPKLRKTLTITPDEPTWFVRCKFPYEHTLKEYIKSVPGSKWMADDKEWRLPREMVQSVTRLAEERGLAVQNVGNHEELLTFCTKDERLHPYQRYAVDRALATPEKRWLFNDGTGVGKSPEAIAVCRALEAKTVLIITPAIVRRNWERELDKWWPDHPDVGILYEGRERKGRSKKKEEELEDFYNSPIQVVSYNLANQAEPFPWDVIIFDEIHRLISPSTSWSEYCRDLVLQNPDAAILGLTATLMPNRPVNAWHPLHVIWPDRFGKLQKNKGGCYAFNKRYALAHDNGYGLVWVGINTANAPELAERLKAVSSRTTKNDILHLLPPFDVRQLFVQPKDRRNYKILQQNLGENFRTHVETVKSDLLQAGDEKIPIAVDWAQGEQDNTTHIAVLTHYRKTAKAIAEKLPHAYCITGEQTPEQRNKMLAEAAAAPEAVVVATMHSVGIGIDLTFCTSALFAELYYRPETMIQALGRFSRLSGKVPSSVTILILEGTIDEIIASRLQGKIESINEAIEGGLEEDVLAQKLSKDDENWLEGLEKAAESYEEDDYE